MDQTTALGTIETLIKARKNKDFKTAFSCYEKDAIIVLQPGQTSKGEEDIKAFIEQVSSLALTFQGHEIIESGDVAYIALHPSKYTLDMGEKGVIKGLTADILRKQPGGTWLTITQPHFDHNRII